MTILLKNINSWVNNANSDINVNNAILICKFNSETFFLTWIKSNLSKVIWKHGFRTVKKEAFSARLTQIQFHTCDFLLLFPFLELENIIFISCTLALLWPFVEIFMRIIIKHVSQDAFSLLCWSGYLRLFFSVCVLVMIAK